jgi:FKBP-type peptidyl-prolyl cis-trans isomerase FklB
MLKMKFTLMAILAVALLSGHASADEPLVLKTQKEKVSYAIGIDVMKALKQQGIQVDMDLVIKGMKDLLSGEKLLMSDSDLRKTMAEFQAELRLKQRQARGTMVEDARKRGETSAGREQDQRGSANPAEQSPVQNHQGR